MLLSWNGAPAAPPELVRAMRRGGWSLAASPRAEADLWVMASRRGDRPPAPPVAAGTWLWVSGARLRGDAVEQAVLRGARDCVSLVAPDAVARLLRRLEESTAPEPQPPTTSTFVTASEAGRRVLRKLANAARTSQPVLITGETGTGKEVSARLVHEWSARHERTFVPVNCAAIPNELMEAELFGYARGAFSGAVRAYDGQIAAAEGGTVFLDEIDDTPPSIQVKLLRVLEDRVVSRLGENVWRRVDFRLIAATNRHLAPLIAAGKFGPDLYERLAIVEVQLPPLRERVADIAVLADHFAARFALEEGRGVERITPEAVAALERYRWPGNVRELRNAIYQSLVEKRAGRELLLSDLPRRILTAGRATATGESAWLAEAVRGVTGGELRLRDALRELERAALIAALARAGGNAAEAARLLGTVGRGAARDPGGTVRSMMRRLGIGR